MQGTRDPAAWLAVPDAIRFQAERDWDAVRAALPPSSHARRAAELCELLGTEPLAPDAMLAQMATVRLARSAPGLSDRLFATHRVEIPVGGADERRPPPLGRRLHDARRDRPAPSRPRSGA